MFGNKYSKLLLDELERLAAAEKSYEFRIDVDREKLPTKAREPFDLLARTLQNCRAAAEFDLAKYRLTNNALGIALWDIDVVSGDPSNPGNKYNWSKGFRKALGFSGESDFPNILSSWSDRLHPDDREGTLAALTAHIADVTGKTPYDIEYRMRTKNGEYRRFRAVGLTMRDESGLPLKVAGALEDITGRVRQQEMLENILNGMDSYIYTTDLETDEMLFVNRKMMDDYKLPENIKGEKCWQRLQDGQSGRCEWCKKDKLIRETGDATSWEEDNPVSGNCIYKIDRIIDWPDGRKVHMQQGVDITEMKQAQEALRQREKRIREADEYAKLLLDATPLACRLWNRKLELLECNEAAAKLFGLNDKQEYIDRYWELTPEYQPDGSLTRDRIRQSIEDTFKTGKYVYDCMYKLPDGTSLPAQNTLVRVPYGDDYVVAAYSRDLREQKKMTAEIGRIDSLLTMANRMAAILFDTAEHENLESVLRESMKLIGRSVGADRVHILQGETVNGIRHFVCKYAWAHNDGNNSIHVTPGMELRGLISAETENEFLQGACLNGSVSILPVALREFFASAGTKSVLMIPVFVQERFWGLVSFSDCSRERFFADDEVSVLRAVSLLIAIAVNRNAQSALIREANNRIRLLINATPLAFNLWDRNYNNIETNDTAVQIFGLRDQKEYLERFFELSPEFQPDGNSSKDDIIRNLDAAFRDGYCKAEWMHQALDGTPIPTEVTLVRLSYGDDYVVAAYIRDLREHKKIIAEIEQRDNLLQIVNEAIDNLLRSEPEDFAKILSRCMGMMARSIRADRMYIHKNSTGDKTRHHANLYEWSDEYVRISEEDESGSSFACGGKAPLIDRILHSGESVQYLARDLPSECRRCFNMRGVEAVMIIPVFLQDEFWGFVGFDNCHAEELFTLNEESVMRSGSMLIASALMRNEYILNVREASAKLEAALCEAERANSAKSDFLAGMSHEMRTPLNAIIGFSEIALDDTKLNEQVQSILEKIYGSGSTLLSIINDLLDLSKIQAGKLEILPCRYDVPSLINDSVIQNVLHIGSRSIRFILDISADMPANLYGDEIRVKRIINNLLSNAIKYTEEGEVELSLRCERDGGDVWMTVRVRDTGIGIKPENMERLFRSYTQLGETSRQRAEGSGLGLALTKSLVEMMDGTVCAESEYGKGSVFTARFRQGYISDIVIGSEVAKSLMNLQYNASKLSRNTRLNRLKLPYARVLIVDDNITNLDVAKGFMKPYGMRVDCMICGRDAIRAIRESDIKYDAIFMDHMMPEMDGIEAARIIREEIGTEYARTIPIIALTANAVAGSEDMFLANGFQGFISKPIDLARLDGMIRRFVRDKDREALWEEASAVCPQDNAAENSACLLLASGGIDGVNIPRGLTLYGDERSFIKILRSYAVNTKPLLESIRYVHEDMLADYAITVHGIKGASRNIFAETAGTLAGELEFAAKTGDFPFVAAKNPDFVVYLHQLIRDIEETLDRIEEYYPKPKKEKIEPSAISGLVAACESFDFDGIDSVMEEIEGFEYTSDSELAGWLLENVSQMNWERIIDRLSTLAKETE